MLCSDNQILIRKIVEKLLQQRFKEYITQLCPRGLVSRGDARGLRRDCVGILLRPVINGEITQPNGIKSLQLQYNLMCLQEPQHDPDDDTLKHS
ncbi:hypothetical protein J6590_014703 [Homalodisca vitripennis]|nr:hypothetical protein J6590_014703 [Homalodisca vitripennis]